MDVLIRVRVVVIFSSSGGSDMGEVVVRIWKWIWLEYD